MATALVNPFIAFSSGNRYLKLSISDTSSGTPYCWLAEIQWKSGGTRLFPTSSSGNADYSTVADSQDNNTGTKWEISNGPYTLPHNLVFDFGGRVTIDSYSFVSPDTNSWISPTRNPKSWTVSTSPDNSTWTVVHTVTNASLPFTDLAVLGTWSIP